VPKTAEPGAAEPGPRRSRTRARRTAVEILYQADVTGGSAADVLQEWAAAGRDLSPFTREVVQGVDHYRAELDALLARHVRDWSVERMAPVDRTILRLASFELLHRPDVPPAAAIAEAVAAAKALSTEESGRFVNGILGSIARELATGAR
jgi:transcription antitermination protein NusB